MALRRIYRRLLRAWGPQHWWPADTPTEVAIGAILTQNTAWGNAARAIDELRRSGELSFPALDRLPVARLAERIRSSGTHRVKALRLQALARLLCREHGGSLESLLAGRDTASIRDRLLRVRGIGPETADAILLYAGRHPVFVVDAYTRRVLLRHGLIEGRPSYAEVQELFHASLPRDAELYGEYHALLVELGKRHCRRRARCEGCPLHDLPHDAER